MECHGSAPLGRRQRKDFFRFYRMSEFAFSPTAQQWINVVLIWVGFGTLAGLLATVIFPMRRSVGPFAAMVMGIVGSTIGLLGLSWLFPGRPLNPISALGFVAATSGAFVLLILYRLGSVFFFRHADDAAKPQR
jgi:uncharacterized membrane protein YeaQ/YmgE (transglycosylase-associated protein family)